MNKAAAEQIITNYLPKIYGFALTKTANLHDAEDLAADIALKLYPALLTQEIENTAAFIWRVAHNTLANYYRGKAKHSLGICIEELYEGFSNGESFEDSIMEAETIKKLQSEIAYLSKTQRTIVILYYYENKKQEEIAALLSIPLGTVKWHLFEAKKEMKKGMETMRNLSELKFNPIKFTWMGLSGSVGAMGGTANFFKSILAQNIAYCVLRQAKTVNEIADCLGVSPVYVESEAEYLEEYGYLTKKGGKYLANMLINEPNDNTRAIVRLQEDMYSKAAKLLANELFDELANSEWLDGKHGVIYNSGFNEAASDKNFMLWSLLFYVAAVSGEDLMDHTISFDEAATIRPDGGKNVAYAEFEAVDGPQQKHSDSMCKWCGPCWNEGDRYRLWMIDSEWSEKRVNDHYQISVQRDLSLLDSYFNTEILSADDYAYLVEKGYLKISGQIKDDFKTALQIVWIQNNETRQKLVAIGDKIKEKYKAELDKLKAPYIKAVMDDTPEHLKIMQAYGMQYVFFSDGWFLLYCAKELVENGKLTPPTEEQRKSLTTLIMPK